MTKNDDTQVIRDQINHEKIEIHVEIFTKN